MPSGVPHSGLGITDKNDDGAEALDAFRDEVRAWLEANCPQEMRVGAGLEENVCWGGRKWRFQSAAQKLWLDRMVARGWTVPSWPKAYGGAGLTRPQAQIVSAEMARIGARAPLESFGIIMLGPALLKYGSEAQKLLFLPQIAHGKLRFCQGFSEPGAGSDLASLRTRATFKDDHFVVNGQKIWTSYADQADWMFCLVRTGADTPPQAGISFLLLDMDSPGVSVRPITLISGKSPFCETFIDDVITPAAHLIGEMNHGWDIAKYLLTHERETIADGAGGLFDSNVAMLREAARSAALRDGGTLAASALRADVVRAEIDTRAFNALLDLYKGETGQGASLGVRSSVAKYFGAELNKRRAELLMAFAGAAGIEWEGGSNDPEIARQWLRTKGNSIEGGTSEIQLEIIAKRILELPSK